MIMNSLNGVDVQDFRTETFLDVCETLSYTRTAERLNITQPAVSQHISYFESVYGAKLFTYQNRRLRLTEAGALVRDTLTTMVHDEQMVREHIASLSGARRSLKLGVTMTAGEYVIAKPLAQFLKHRSDLQASVVAADTETLLGMLQKGEIDCAFMEGFFDKSEYDSKVFCSERLVAVCSPEHKWEKRPKKLADLLGEHLVVREAGSGTRAALEHALAANNLVIDAFARTTEVTSLNIIKTFVEQDYGIAFLYESAVRAECESGSLQEINLTDTKIKHDMTFIWLKGSAFAEEFRTMIADLTMSF